MGFTRGDVVLLRHRGGPKHSDRAALIWRVSDTDTWFFLISGARSLERSQRHRSERDIPIGEAIEMGLTMGYPVVYCHHQNKLDASRLSSQDPIGRASDGFMRMVSQVWAREVATQETENRLAYRPQFLRFAYP